MSDSGATPIVDICKEFRFEAAHLIPGAPAGHKCARLHGHSFRFEVRLRGPIDPQIGWLIDFGEISRVVRPLVENELDHRYLNEIPGLENPTSETLAVWLWRRLQPQLPQLVEITVHETCTTRAVFRG